MFSGVGGRDRKTGGKKDWQFSHQKQKNCVLPWRIGRSNEEIDDHPVAHVEAMLHRPAGETHQTKFSGNERPEVGVTTPLGHDCRRSQFSRHT